MSMLCTYIIISFIQEKFIKFVHIQDRLGSGLANLLMREVTDLGIRII